ncbi:MAG TPA: hypothetical protein VGX37_00815 [Allosphingosinicella sp.]|jgi:uncharacterized membrane protein YjdF|nr:hypothetical protein [Allosphingosinicella sp.]
MNLPALYERVIFWIGDGTGASDTLLHVHAGLAVLFLARIVTRRSLATPVPFLVVCAAEFGNELMDYLGYGSWRWHDTLTDIVNTLFWPLVLMIGLRLRRARDSRPDSARAEAAGA